MEEAVRNRVILSPAALTLCFAQSNLPMNRHSGAPISHPRDPLHGITLETIVSRLVARHGWAEMGRRIPVRCFLHAPSVKSSLTFLRKTPWARKKIEDIYLESLRLD